MAKQFRVIGACVTDIPVQTSNGVIRTTLYQDAVLPEGVPAERIAHLLDVKLIEEIGGGKSQPLVTKESIEAGARESGEGRTVNSRSSKAELVDHGVAKGDSRAELEAMTFKELQAKYVKADQT